MVQFVSVGLRLDGFPSIPWAPGGRGTNLKVPEIDPSFPFLVFAGIGASHFVTDRTAVYPGYRWTHMSNGGTSSPNRARRQVHEAEQRAGAAAGKPE